MVDIFTRWLEDLYFYCSICAGQVSPLVDTPQLVHYIKNEKKNKNQILESIFCTNASVTKHYHSIYILAGGIYHSMNKADMAKVMTEAIPYLTNPDSTALSLKITEIRWYTRVNS